MPAARASRPLALALALVLAAACVPLPAGATALLNVRAETGAKASRAVLTFDNGIPSYRIFGNGTNDPAILLVGATRSPNARAGISGKNSLKSITLDSLGGSAEITFHESRATTLAVQSGAGQTLIVTLSAAAVESPAPFGAVPVGPPPMPAPAAAEDVHTDVVALKYADVSEIVGLLVPGQQIPSNDTFVAQPQSYGSSGLGGGFGGIGGIGSTAGGAGGTLGAFNPATAQPGTAFAQTAAGSGVAAGQQINETIGIDRRLNAVVLTGSLDTIARLKAKIARLDIPLASVALETQVVELTDTAARDAGIDFTTAGGQLAGATYQIKSLTTGQGTINLQAAVYAQVRKGLGRVIARPRVVAQSGGSAQIITGDALPIVTSIAVSGVNAVSQQVQYVNVGVNLQISPRISTDGFVTSHIYSEVSSVTGYSQGYPTLSQREATTAATVRDGEAFVIGGLLQQDDISNLAKLPGIGNIPLIGGLFRVRHDTRTLTNLYIIVVPHILSNGNPVPPNVPTN